MTPRDVSAAFEAAEIQIRQQLSSLPDATLIDSDRKNRIVVIDAPADSEAAIRNTLGSDFFVDLNAPLRF